MTTALSINTKAILLLTAPLIVGRGTPSADLVSLGEYKRLARRLRELQGQPADLLSDRAPELMRACERIVEPARLQRLLSRGFLLSQAIERWQARAIWVVSRADSDYPRRLKPRLREDAPALLYGCGDATLLETGGLAVVGSRHVEDELIQYTMNIGRLAARARRTLVSGGAKGIDQAAMRGALEAGGMVVGVLADSLERTAMNREHRDFLIDGRLVLTSPYDPSAGFNVGNAMQRNKVIYALADAALVVSSNVNKGGTWAGAIEQLQTFRAVTVYVRSTGPQTDGLNALRKSGAVDWPNPRDVDAFDVILDAVQPSSGPEQVALALESDSTPAERTANASCAVAEIDHQPASRQEQPAVGSPPSAQHASPAEAPREPEVATPESQPKLNGEVRPADALFKFARELIRQILTAPMKEAEIASALDVSASQAKIWLQRLVSEGVVEKQKKRAAYTLKHSHPLER